MERMRSEMSDTEAEPGESAPRERDGEPEQEATRERLFRSVLSWRKPDSGRWRVLRSR